MLQDVSAGIIGLFIPVCGAIFGLSICFCTYCEQNKDKIIKWIYDILLFILKEDKTETIIDD